MLQPKERLKLSLFTESSLAKFTCSSTSVYSTPSFVNLMKLNLVHRSVNDINLITAVIHEVIGHNGHKEHICTSSHFGKNIEHQLYNPAEKIHN